MITPFIRLPSWQYLFPVLHKNKSLAVADRPRDASCHWIFR